MSKMNFYKSRRFKQGTVATVFTALVIVLVVIINMVATALSSRFNMTLDLTAGSVFTLSQESEDFLATVEKDVNIYVLNDEETFTARGTYFTQANEVIKRYAKQQPRITLRYTDIVKDPSFAANYPDMTLNTGSILVECGNQHVVLTAYDLFNTQLDETTYQTSITSSKAEQALSSAILNVTSDEKIRVSVLTGHNETEVTDFTTLLQTNNYEIITQNLMTDEIDPEATIAIMCNPSRDISEDEAKKLDAFLSNGEKFGKTLFYLASANQQAALPMLDAFLTDWGIKVNPGVVFETNQSNLFQINIFMTLAEYMESEYSESVREKNMVAAIANSRPLEFLFEEKGNTSTVGLLQFSSTSGVRPADAAEDWTPESEGTSGPILAMGIGQRLKYDGTTPQISTVLVAGSETLIDPYLLGSSNIANSEYLLNLFNDLSGREDIVYIQDKTIGNTQLGITSTSQVVAIGVVFVVVLPLAVLISGIVIWMRRRHR
jgi:ABC-type uncharacterized transport system involved in gliding motility auxiliary subunit